MNLSLAVILLVLAATATMAAFGGDTWVKGTEPLLKRVTRRGWVSLSCLLCTLVLGIVKEIRSASTAEEAKAELKQLRDTNEKMRSELALVAKQRFGYSYFLPWPPPPFNPQDPIWEYTSTDPLYRDHHPGSLWRFIVYDVKDNKPLVLRANDTIRWCVTMTAFQNPKDNVQLFRLHLFNSNGPSRYVTVMSPDRPLGPTMGEYHIPVNQAPANPYADDVLTLYAIADKGANAWSLTIKIEYVDPK